jgi:hypothetical protein
VRGSCAAGDLTNHRGLATCGFRPSRASSGKNSAALTGADQASELLGKLQRKLPGRAWRHPGHPD